MAFQVNYVITLVNRGGALAYGLDRVSLDNDIPRLVQMVGIIHRQYATSLDDSSFSFHVIISLMEPDGGILVWRLRRRLAYHSSSRGNQYNELRSFFVFALYETTLSITSVRKYGMIWTIYGGIFVTFCS